MNDSTTVDARGLSCPQPAMLVRQAMREIEKGTVEVMVDTGTARENVTRLARQAGWEVTIEPQPESACRIVLRR